VVTGRVAEAARLLSAPAPRLDDTDPRPRRLSAAAVHALLTGGGLDVAAVCGVRVFTDLVPAAAVDGDVEASRALLELERLAAGHPDHARLAELATQLHVVARRPA
jgi:hypothetical protein